MSADPMELIYSLIGYPSETEWIEFKESNNDCVRIAQDISALSNSAAFRGRDCAYRIWGVEDGSHALVGTKFDYLKSIAKGRQGLLIWLKTVLSKNANYEFDQFDRDGKHYVVLTVRAASMQPVYYGSTAYIREGNSTTTLNPGSAKEAELWERLQGADFESLPAETDLLATDVPGLIHVDAYFDLLDLKHPSDIKSAMTPLVEQELLRKQDNGRYTITNLGALLLAKKMSDFPGLRKRQLRIVRFSGTGNFEILDDKTLPDGYALALTKAAELIMSMIPATEVTEGAHRIIRYAYPQRAIREFLSNAVIHQDLTDTSSGPRVDLYENRISFSNPGVSLIPVKRILNAQPKTRNNGLVGILRQMDLCEEGGSGWDIAVAACEAAHLPSPQIESDEDLGTRVTLFRGPAYDRMTKRERADALYWHACLMFANGASMNNQSLRERFGLGNERKNTLAMSRLIRECCDAGLIKEEDEEAGPKNKRYIPGWA